MAHSKLKTNQSRPHIIYLSLSAKRSSNIIHSHYQFKHSATILNCFLHFLISILSNLVCCIFEFFFKDSYPTRAHFVWSSCLTWPKRMRFKGSISCKCVDVWKWKKNSWFISSVGVKIHPKDWEIAYASSKHLSSRRYTSRSSQFEEGYYKRGTSKHILVKSLFANTENTNNPTYF